MADDDSRDGPGGGKPAGRAPRAGTLIGGTPGFGTGLELDISPADEQADGQAFGATDDEMDDLEFDPTSVARAEPAMPWEAAGIVEPVDGPGPNLMDLDAPPEPAGRAASAGAGEPAAGAPRAAGGASPASPGAGELGLGELSLGELGLGELGLGEGGAGELGLGEPGAGATAAAFTDASAMDDDGEYIPRESLPPTSQAALASLEFGVPSRGESSGSLRPSMPVDAGELKPLVAPKPQGAQPPSSPGLSLSQPPSSLGLSLSQPSSSPGLSLSQPPSSSGLSLSQPPGSAPASSISSAQGKASIPSLGPKGTLSSATAAHANAAHAGPASPTGAAPQVAPGELAAPAPAAAPAAGLGAASAVGSIGIGSGPADWDLDDDLDGGMAQLDTAVPVADKEDDGPWPMGRTPAPDDFDFDVEQVRSESGFGPAPSNFFGAPMYYVRSALGLRQLKTRIDEADSRLQQLEHGRDVILAGLAEGMRTELQDKDRFRSLFADADKFDAMIKDRQRVLQAADAQVAEVLADVDRQLSEAQAERAERQHQSAQQLEITELGRQNLQRAKAAIRRTEIERRNVLAQARQLVPEGANMPPELGARYLVLEDERKQAESAFERAREPQRELEVRYEKLEDDHRRSVAEMLAIEERKAGLIMAYEGELAEHVRSLQEAQDNRLQHVSNAGRVLLELRNEVKTDKTIRIALQASDEAIEAAARQAALLQRAHESLDQSAFDTGRALLIGAGIGLVILLLVAAFT